MVAVLNGVRLVEVGDRVLVANSKRKRGFEPHTVELWSMLAYRGKVMIDAGAYTGFYSILAAKCGAGRVYAYEPNPSAAARMRENIGLNAVDGVTVRECALWSRASEQPLRGRTSLTSAGSLVSEGREIASVRTVRLDDEGIGKVYAIKIDVERSEVELLKGAMETIARCKPHILIEALDGTEMIDSLLCPLGYQGRTLDRGMHYYRVTAK